MLQDDGIDVEADNKLLETQHWLELIDGCVLFIDVLCARTVKYLLLDSIGMVPIVELADISHLRPATQKLTPNNSQGELQILVYFLLNDRLAVVP